MSSWFSAPEPPPPTASEIHCVYCFDVLAAHFKRQSPPTPPFNVDVACPLFVTWNKRARGGGGYHQLRGCIGCLKPLPLSSLRDYSLTSALHDRRFAPIELDEMPRLQCTVQLLGRFEPCALYDWTIGEHGLTISFVDMHSHGTPQRSAVYLPDVIAEQGWTQEEAIDSLIRKSGCEAHITEELRYSLEVCRFISTRCSLPYDQWASLRAAASSAASSSTPRTTTNGNHANGSTSSRNGHPSQQQQQVVAPPQPPPQQQAQQAQHAQQAQQTNGESDGGRSSRTSRSSNNNGAPASAASPAPVPAVVPPPGLGLPPQPPPPQQPQAPIPLSDPIPPTPKPEEEACEEVPVEV